MLIVLCGYTAVGKDTYQNWLLNRNNNLRRAVSYTTRPIRQGEKEGREYYFINEFSYMILEEEAKILSSRSYNTYENGEKTMWHYGLPKSEVTNDRKSITILDHAGARRVKNILGEENVKIVYLYTSKEEVLYNRSLSRLDEIKEFERRLEDDKEKFKGVNITSDLMIQTDVDKDTHELNLKKIESLMEVQNV